MTMKQKTAALLVRIKNILVVTLIPIVFTLIFGAVYSHVYVENIPMAVLDLDHSTLSRTVVESFDESTGFSLTDQVQTQEQLDQLLLTGKVKAGLILPAHFGQDVTDKKSPSALVLMDGTNIVIGNNVYSYASTILSTLNVGVQMNMLEAGQMVPYMAEQNLTTLSFEDRMLYDPHLGYFLFTFAGFLGIFVQQTYLSVVAPGFIEERERRSSRLWKDPVFYGVLSFIASMSCLLLAHYLFGYPLRGSLILTLACQAVLLFALTGVTLFLTTFFDDVAHCVQFLMFLSIPTLLTSGYVWPEFMMAPHFAPFVKAVWPLYYYVNPLRELQMRGGGLSDVSPYLIQGLIYAVVWMLIGIWAFRRKIRTVDGLRLKEQKALSQS